MLVSIYMPTKNRIDSMPAAVASVLAQSYEEIELIVVDDGSTDGTQDYMKSLASINPKVKYIRNDVSKGACYARNIAIKASSGVFITGLDDDDEFLENHVSSLVQYWILLNKSSEKACSCIFTQYLLRNKNARNESSKKSKVEYYEMFEANHVGNQIFAPREHYFGAGLFDEKMPAWQDLEFFFRVIQKFGPARLLDLSSYVFDVTPRPDRISCAHKPRILDAAKRMIALHAKDNSRNAQKLQLQIHGGYYDFEVTTRDFLRFAKTGFWFKGYLQMILFVLRSKRKKLYNLIHKVKLILKSTIPEQRITQEPF